MSEIVVFGANGKAGQRIVKEALDRGHSVTAVVRYPDSARDVDARAVLAQGDATVASSVREHVSTAHAVVLAIGSYTATPWLKAAKTMLEVLSAEPSPRARLLHMGGGASLLEPDGRWIIDSPYFPPEHLENARGQILALDWYRRNAKAAGVEWTYVSPPPIHFAPGERRGIYRTALNTPVVDAEGNAVLSYEDLAVVIIDEIETPQHVNTRFTAGY
jgi:putative NADH-flavin reductase